MRLYCYSVYDTHLLHLLAPVSYLVTLVAYIMFYEVFYLGYNFSVSQVKPFQSIIPVLILKSTP